MRKSVTLWREGLRKATQKSGRDAQAWVSWVRQTFYRARILNLTRRVYITMERMHSTFPLHKTIPLQPVTMTG